MNVLRISFWSAFILLAIRLIVFIGEPDYFRAGEKKIDAFLEKITK